MHLEESRDKPAMALERASHSIGHNEHSVTGKDGMDGDGGNVDGGAGGRWCYDGASSPEDRG